MLENVSTDKIDLRVRRSRKNLIEALHSLMQEQPLQKISVQDITELAMVNRSTFYAHFTDKYDLFKAAIGDRIRRDLSSGFVNSTGFNEENLRMLIITAGNLMLKINKDCKPTSTSELTPLIMVELQNGIYETVLNWTKQLDSAVATNKLAIFTSGLIFGGVTLWGQHFMNDLSIEQFTNQIIPMLIEGVGKSLTT
ncbi:MAG: TetR/AcrR family transcriptional regulator [Chloroflexota bacterium]